MATAASDTNSLTMKLLALANFSEGAKAAEIRDVVAQLAAATYRERDAASKEIERLRAENKELKLRLPLEAIAKPLPPPPTAAPRRDNGRQVTRFDMRTPASTVKTRDDRRPGHNARDPRLSPPDFKDLFPEFTPHRPPPAKRAREHSPERNLPSLRKRPECVGCFQIGSACDGKPVCSVCQARKYGCEYRECWDGERCGDRACTRLHPDQWSSKEEARKVKRWVK